MPTTWNSAFVMILELNNKYPLYNMISCKDYIVQTLALFENIKTIAHCKK